MARQDPNHRSPERPEMQSVRTLQKLAQLRWAGNVTRMPDERLPKKSSLENYKWENIPKVARERDTKHL